MRVAFGLVAVLVVVFAVPAFRSGLRDWRDGGGTPFWERHGLLVDAETRAGYERSGLIIGLGFAFMALMLAGLAETDLRHVNRAESLAFAVAAGGMIVCFSLVFSIISFNRPKFLVPPQHRGELGAFAAQRRRRAGRHVR